MGLNDIVARFRKVTTNVLKVNTKLQVGDQQIVLNNGNSYFVDSDASNASDTNSGTSWSSPLATLDGAVNKCSDNQGDIIYVAESHSESYTTTGTKCTIDVDGITIVGLGTGSDRPTFSFGHTGANWVISGDNVTIVNLLFLTAVDSVVKYGTISGADIKIIDCESRDVANKEVIDAWLVTTTASRLVVDNYTHIGDVATGDASESIFNLTDVSDWTIKNSKFITLVGTGIIEIASTASNAVVDNCIFYVAGTSDLSLNIVDTDDDSTIVVRNCFDLAVMSKFSGGNAGSGFSVAGDDVSDITDALYGANGIPTFPTPAAPSNNVSMAEVLRDVWDALRNGTGGSEPGTNLSIIDELKRDMTHKDNPNYIKVTADLSSATWNTVASHEIATVTGLVRMKLIAEVTTTGDDTSGNTSTIQLGVEGTTNDWIAATEVDDLAEGELWNDATPTVAQGDTSSYMFDKLVNGLDIGYEIAGEAATAGVIDFHIFWLPISSDGSVVAGAGGSL